MPPLLSILLPLCCFLPVAPPPGPRGDNLCLPPVYKHLVLGTCEGLSPSLFFVSLVSACLRAWCVCDWEELRQGGAGSQQQELLVSGTRVWNVKETLDLDLLQMLMEESFFQPRHT